MESRHYTGDDNTSAADLTDAERDERLRDLEENSLEPLTTFTAPPLTEEERLWLQQGHAIAAAIRRATTFSN